MLSLCSMDVDLTARSPDAEARALCDAKTCELALAQGYEPPEDKRRVPGAAATRST
ncbi:MAG: hypothetical protein V3S27_10025 [Kiloniellales bacterium]